MNQIQLKIEAVSPLAIGRQKPGGSISEAESYIPGSVIRGAIAGEIIQQYGQPEPGDDFHTLFLGDTPAIFQNAYPANTKVEKQEMVLPGEIWVLPATAISSKTNSGFKPKKNGVFDTLIDRFCAEGYNHPYDPSDPNSTEDHGRVEPFSGFYSRTDQLYCQTSIANRLLTRVGINRRRATAEEQVLYSIEVLNEVRGKTEQPAFEGKTEQPATYKGAILVGKTKQPATYKGAILVEDQELANALAEFINSHSFRLGGSASRGLGKVQITPNLSTVTPTVASRITQFNAELQKRWQMWQIFGEPHQDLLNGPTYFTLDLQSDAILTENWQRTTVISPTMLQQFANIDDPSLRLQVAYTSYDYRSGWNATWGLMKDVELVTNKGAVYLFSTTQPELWTDALGDLEMQGVGDRTSEGFGQVQICHQFHLVFREHAV